MNKGVYHSLRYVFVFAVLFMLLAAAAAFADVTVFDVTDERFGADGTDAADDWRAIQDALNTAKETDDEITVNVPSGDYYISDTLIIYANTKLILDSNAKIIRSNDAVQMLVNGSKTGEETGGYGRSAGITVRGGTWDGNASGDNNANLFYFYHAEQITISGVTMKNCCGNHFIEFAAVKDSAITGCSFSSFIRHNGTDYSALDNGGEGPTGQVSSITSEAIQLDYASAETSSQAKPLDNTACSGISVTNCSFSNCLSGIGNHHTDTLSAGLVVKNNQFSNLQNTCINLSGFNGAVIEGNSAAKVRRFIYGTNNAGTITVKNNTVASQLENTSDNCIEFRSSATVQIISNELHAFNYGIFISACEATVDQNTIEGSGKAGIRLRDGAEGTVSANQITGAVETGITVLACANLQIVDNIIDDIQETGIHVYDYQGDIDGNYITHCGAYNIYTDGTCSGNIINNTYDLGYGIVNLGEMTRAANTNTLLGSEQEPTGFTVYYHLTDDAEASDVCTEIEFGVMTKTKTTDELGFFIEGKQFLGWKGYRNDTKAWGILKDDGSGSFEWKTSLPDGREYFLFGEGYGGAKTVPIGAELHFYAQWEETGTFTVYYHKNEDANASSTITEVAYGTLTETAGYEELWYPESGRRFLGWKVYRSDTKAWRINENGTIRWSSTLTGNEEFALAENRCCVSDDVPAGAKLRYYAQWEDTDKFTVYYHLTNGSGASDQVTVVTYGTATPLLKLSELGFELPGGTFLGWRGYWLDYMRWRVEDASGSASWQSAVPEGGRYYLYGDGWSVSKTVYAGSNLHLYAQWKVTWTLPEELTEIEEEAFAGIGTAAEIILGNHVERIGSKAFASMASLEYITIPDSVTFIADDAFSGSTPTFRCNPGSYAYQYADSHGIPCTALE